MRPLLSACVLLCSLFSAQAQKLNVSTIAFSGDSLPSADLLAASGLKSGPLDAAEVQAGAQKLNDSGMFSHIGFAVRGGALEFQLTPATGSVPAHFENFPWWTDKVLIEKVHAVAPLFEGRVIPGTGLDQQVAGALTTLVAAEHITATVESHAEIVGAGAAAVRYRIATPAITVGMVTLNGGSSAMSKELAPIAKAASGQPYDAYATPDLLQQAIWSVYGNRGYLEVSAKATRGELSAAADGIAVPMEVEIVEGPQYRLEAMRFAHPLLLNEAEFQSKASLHPGDIANQELLRSSLLLVDTPYRKQGYLRAKITAAPSLNTATQKVSYAIEVEPGDVYRFGKLSLANASDVQRREFLMKWKLQAGDIYDATYTPSFLTSNAKSLHSFEGYSATYKEITHLDTHVVDLEITCQKGGPLR